MALKYSKLFNQSLEKFIDEIRTGSEREVGRAISLLEDQNPLSKKIMSKLYQDYQKAYLIGITGAAGSGKSSLLNLILQEYSQKSDAKLAVIAVDPTAQKSGGAFLGDRIRMKNLFSEKKFFIRSMASRGSYGGVNTAVYDTAVILAAAGYQKIIVETVGVGQTEIDILAFADTTLVVAVPEAGDEIQIFKSELMELGDIFILNKTDLPQAAKMEILIKSLLSLKNNNSLKQKSLAQQSLAQKNLTQKKAENLGWDTPLIKASALNNEGIAAIVAAIESHYNYLLKNNLFTEKRNIQLKKHLFNLLKAKTAEKILNKFEAEFDLESYSRIILSGKSSPDQLIENFITDKLKI